MDGLESTFLPQNSRLRELLRLAPSGQLKRVGDACSVLLVENLGQADDPASVNAIDTALADEYEARGTLLQLEPQGGVEAFSILCADSRCRGSPGGIASYFDQRLGYKYMVETRTLCVPVRDDTLEDVESEVVDGMRDEFRLALEQGVIKYLSENTAQPSGFLVWLRVAGDVRKVTIHMITEHVDPVSCVFARWKSSFKFEFESGKRAECHGEVASHAALLEAENWCFRQRKSVFDQELLTLTPEDTRSPPTLTAAVLDRVGRMEKQVLRGLRNVTNTVRFREINNAARTGRRVPSEKQSSTLLDDLVSEISKSGAGCSSGADLISEGRYSGVAAGIS